MSDYAAICESDPAFNGLSDVTDEGSWPFDWDTTIPADFAFEEMSRHDIFQLLLRIKTLRCLVDWDEELRDEDDVLLDTRTYSFDFNLTRNAADETQVLAPYGISATYGQTSVLTNCKFSGSQILTDEPGLGDNVSIDLSIDFFRKNLWFAFPDEVQVPHMAFNSGTGLWIPSCTIEGTIDVESGLEYIHTLRSYIDPATVPAPTGTFNADVISGWGGGDKLVNVYSDSTGYLYTNASFNIIVSEFFTWDGRWHATTGAAINPPPGYP